MAKGWCSMCLANKGRNEKHNINKPTKVANNSGAKSITGNIDACMQCHS